MKTFQEYLNEGKIITIDGISFHIADNGHAHQRLTTRSSSDFYSMEDLKNIISSSIEKLKIIKDQEFCLLFSVSKNRGIILKRSENNFFVVTILPVGKQFAKPGTVKILTESKEIYEENFIMYMNSLLEKIEEVEIIELEDCSITYVEGCFWDFTGSVMVVE